MASMDAKPARSSGESFSGDENLPLYDEFQCVESQNGELPASTATPDEVRNFMAHLLVSQRQLPQDYARRVAARWTIGSGVEMRSYSPSMYLEIFGQEDGWILYREVKLAIHRHKNKRTIYRYRFHIVAATLLLFELSMVVLLLCLNEGGAILVGLFGVGPGAAGLLGATLALCLGDSPEKAVEAELRSCTSRTRNPQN